MPSSDCDRPSAPSPDPAPAADADASASAARAGVPTDVGVWLASGRRGVRRIVDGTPPGRDRALDALRAGAIVGVVVGHWLVTALVVESGGLRVTSPLKALPQLAPVSWVFQALALFFLVGGLVAAKSHRSARADGMGYVPWLRARLERLFRPVAAVLVVWGVAAAGMLASGLPLDTVRALVKLVAGPMWFLLVYAALTAATPLVARLHPLWPLALVACSDLLRFGLGRPTGSGGLDAFGSVPTGSGGMDAFGWVATGSGGMDAFGWMPGVLWWVNVVAGWLVPYCLGAAWGRGALSGRGVAWVMLGGGGGLAVGLVVWGGYPAAMVGVPGAPGSNLDPPSLAAVAFGIAQCGAASLLLGPLRRVLRRPVLWAGVAVVNLAAMTIFLWHQTAMIAVTELGLLAGTALAGLHTVPDGLGWVAARLAWLPVFGTALAVCCAAFHAYERGTARAASRSPR